MPMAIGSKITRRTFIEGCAATAMAVKSWSAEKPEVMHAGISRHTQLLDGDWLFGGKTQPRATDPTFDDSAFTHVNLPHSVAPLSWHKWNPSAWEDKWIYRRHFTVPHNWQNMRIFVHFDRVLAGAVPVINGHRLESHLGGFLPFEREISGLVHEGDNLLAIEVDSRWLDVPPSGSPQGPTAVDYLLPGGITGPVELRAVPAIFLHEVYAKPVDVLTATPSVELTCSLDTARQLPTHALLSAVLRKEGHVVASSSQNVKIERANQEVRFTIAGLRNVELWDLDHPHLYTVEVTLATDGTPLHQAFTRIGFREARFETDGFYLNGKRVQLFGLNRHELFPYVGFAAPPRLLRRDAEILRRAFNCNVVRCSHYPQSEAFLDACDELGLMVWEELPGWQYIGDDRWQDLAVHDVEAMIRRDRNHPAIIIWGVRINESPNNPLFYRCTREVSKSLDDTRATSGTMTPSSRKDWQTGWHQDVFAFDDYHADPIGSVGIFEPIQGFPYMIAEAVGQFNYRTGKGFAVRYQRAGDITQQTDQAIFHAQAHNKAAEYPRIAGVIAWCAFDYASLMNDSNAVKCPGVADVFRLNKLGASFYLAQTDPSARPVIEPNFYWDFGVQIPNGPGEHAAIFSNCDRLELMIDGKPHATLHPDRAHYPNLKYPPFFADLKLDGTAHPELRIDGYLEGRRVLSRSFSSDPATDRLWLHVDDTELICDGSDATRVAFAVVDKFGAPRAFAKGVVALHIDGPGTIVGDNPFSLAENGGAGAVYVKTVAGQEGEIRIEALHSALVRETVVIHAHMAKS